MSAIAADGVRSAAASYAISYRMAPGAAKGVGCQEQPKYRSCSVDGSDGARWTREGEQSDKVYGGGRGTAAKVVTWHNREEERRREEESACVNPAET